MTFTTFCWIRLIHSVYTIDTWSKNKLKLIQLRGNRWKHKVQNYKSVPALEKNITKVRGPRTEWTQIWKIFRRNTFWSLLPSKRHVPFYVIRVRLYSNNNSHHRFCKQKLILQQIEFLLLDSFFSYTNGNKFRDWNHFDFGKFSIFVFFFFIKLRFQFRFRFKIFLQSFGYLLINQNRTNKVFVSEIYANLRLRF